jgi:maltooligosyltrehalose trehalohydrolase
VDAAHALGLAVFLDAVYNHFGPDGAYAVAAAPEFLSPRHQTPWGPAVNLDGEAAGPVRAFFIENALHWLVEYHLDGLRLDATQTLIDEGPRPFLAELVATVRAAGGRPRLLIAEDNRNLTLLVRSPEQGGYGLDAVWSDDYHHQVRAVVTGDQSGYFVDFTRATADLATIIRRGWLYTGQLSPYFGGPRGSDPGGIPAPRFIHFIQNHDQVANRPTGDRLNHVITPAAYRALSALLLCAPQTPLLFMGQEWAASSPFLYFTDHAGELGRQVSEGRRLEFAAFPGFADEVPDPQDPETFARSRLGWDEREAGVHAGTLRCYRDLLTWRRRFGGLEAEAASPADGAVILQRGRYRLLVVLDGSASLRCPEDAAVVWQSEDPAYTAHPDPPVRAGGVLRFGGPAAVLLERAQ